MTDTQNKVIPNPNGGVPHNSIPGQNKINNIKPAHNTSNDTHTVTSNYWAAQAIDDLGAELLQKVDSYYQYLIVKGFFAQWMKIYLMYYSGKANLGTIQAAGMQGELSTITVNNLKSLVQSLMTITVDERPTWDAQAINGDVKTQKQTILATGLLDYTMREKRVERDLMKAVEYACVYGEGFVSVSWDVSLGETLSYTDSEHPIKEGDLSYASHEPVDVIRDVRLQDYRSRDWIIVRKYVNKYNLSAQFPNKSSEIESMSVNGDNVRYHYRFNQAQTFDTDVIPVYCFYHSKTAALEQGRYTMFIANGTILVDTALPYRHIPVGRVVASDLIGTPFGYSMMMDLTAIQENLDMLYSTVLTNQRAFGVQNILVPLGSGLNVTHIPGQMNFLEFNPAVGKPETLNLLATAQEIPQMIKILEQKQIELMGLNDAARGNTPSANMSGAALALLDSKAIQLNQQLQWSYIELLEDLGTWTVEIWKDYAKSPKTAMIVGENNRSKVVEFTGDDLSGIDRVLVQSGNPLSKTTSGKLQVAQLLMQIPGLITSPDEILQLIQTGTIEPLIQGPTNELLLIKAENENLSDGKSQPVIATDNHILHITEHSSVLADPSARADPSVTAAALQHINDHIHALQDPQNATLNQLLHQPNLGAPQGGPPGAPPSGAAPVQPGQSPPAPQHGPPASVNTPLMGAAQSSNAMAQAHLPSLPGAPKIAGTHQAASLPAGSAIKQH